MEKLNMHTKDFASVYSKELARLFPECVTEVSGDNGEIRRAIDFDKLKQILATDVIEGQTERYQFTWPDKKKAIRLANSPTNMTLRPCREESVNFDTTENLYIEGDNLEVLKLLREDYLGKVKMIYIDPPYNTGNDFVYEDDFSQTSADYLGSSGQIDSEGNRLVQNTESNGRFHSDWLNMMYARLRAAKDLLAQDGIICISIDDHEITNLVQIGTEIFGANNLIGSIIVKSNPRGSMAEGVIASLHEYVVVFCKDVYSHSIIGHKLSGEMESEYKYSDSLGSYRLLGLRMRGASGGDQSVRSFTIRYTLTQIPEQFHQIRATAILKCLSQFNPQREKMGHGVGVKKKLHLMLIFCWQNKCRVDKRRSGIYSRKTILSRREKGARRLNPSGKKARLIIRTEPLKLKSCLGIAPFSVTLSPHIWFQD